MSLERGKRIAMHVIPILNERTSLDELNQVYIRQAILFCGGNKSQAANLLRLSRNRVMRAIDVFSWDELKGSLSMDELLSRNVISLDEYKRLRAKINSP
jgi:hypothetical protein